MSARTILTLANGAGVDLLAPTAADVDFDAIAEQLAKEPRFNGATRGRFYSVAEHCCRGADAILAETGADGVAAYFLLHDGHEAFLRDDTTPKKVAIAELAAERFGVLADHIMETFRLLEYRLDAAIHEAAGLPWPVGYSLGVSVKNYDLRMFATEWRDLMAHGEHPDWAPYVGYRPVPEPIGSPWDWQTAKIAWLRRAHKLLPVFNGRAMPVRDPISGGVVS